MKKSLFVLGVAVAALASCTSEEVVDVAQNRAIKFDSFVNNNTRAVTEVPAGEIATSDFFVFGNYADDINNTYSGIAFNNDKADRQVAWVNNKVYRFAAYADGAGNNLTTTDQVVYTVNDQKLEFKNYTPDDAKDLVAAITDVTTAVNTATNIEKVSLSFKHMLSQVQFTFKTQIDADYTLEISNIKVNAVRTANGTYIKDQDPTWTAVTENDGKSDYEYETIVDLAKPATDATVDPDYFTASVGKLVIPQSGTNQLSVTFDVKLWGHDILEGTPKTAKLKGMLTYTPASGENVTGKGTANTWTPGYKYNYTATIEMKDIDPTVKIIEFTPTVTDWIPADDQDTEVTTGN